MIYTLKNLSFVSLFLFDNTEGETTKILGVS